MTGPLKRVVSVAILILLALAVARAATLRYKEREDAFRKECQAQRQKLAATGEVRRFPTPEIHLGSGGCVLPGATAEIVIAGRFEPDSRFFVENDNIEVVKESIAGNQYHATLRAAPGIGPEKADVAVMQPITARMAKADNAVRVGGRYEWTMNATNGWKVVARSKTVDPCGRDTDQYEVSFFHAGENKPFERMEGRLDFSPFSRQNYGFNLSPPPPAELENYQAMMQKLSDPKLSSAERQQLMTKMGEVQKQMMASMSPEVIKQRSQEQLRREQEFGCRGIGLTEEGGKLTGEMTCAEKVGRRLAVTGAVAPIK